MQMAALHIRIMAKLIDLFVIFITQLAILLIVDFDIDAYSYVPTVLFLVLLLLSDSVNGQSLGKRIFKIRAINFKSQAPIGIVRSMIRNSLFVLNFFLLPALINYMLYVSYFRRIGDFIAGTCVISTRDASHPSDL